MTSFTSVPPPDVPAGFRVVAGRPQGLHRLLVVRGRLPAGDRGPVHLHAGDEVLHVIEGTLQIRVGDERRTCGPGDVAAVPPNTPHGFRVLTDTVLEVVGEHDMGTFYLVPGPDGTPRLQGVTRPDLPWSTPGPQTTDDELAAILAAVPDDPWPDPRGLIPGT